MFVSEGIGTDQNIISLSATDVSVSFLLVGKVVAKPPLTRVWEFSVAVSFVSYEGSICYRRRPIQHSPLLVIRFCYRHSDLHSAISGMGGGGGKRDLKRDR